MHCGYLDESEWLHAAKGDGNLRVPKRIGAGPTMEPPGVEWMDEDPSTGERFPDVCPGWATRLPIVSECAQAFKAFDKGALPALYPFISNQVAEGVADLGRAFDEYSRQQITAASARNGNG